MNTTIEQFMDQVQAKILEKDFMLHEVTGLWQF